MKQQDLECKTVDFPTDSIQTRGRHRYLYVCEGLGNPKIIIGESYRTCKEKDCFNLRRYEIKPEPDGWEE